jgi:TonB family protein
MLKPQRGASMSSSSIKRQKTSGKSRLWQCCYYVAMAVAIAALISATNAVFGQNPSNDANPPTYPETADGLRALLQDVFAAVKVKDDAKTSAYFSAMALPNSDDWFAKTFGPTEGPRLGAKYAELLPEMPATLGQIFEDANASGHTDPSVVMVSKTGSFGGHEQAIVNATLAPVSLFVPSVSTLTHQSEGVRGDFVYVDGAFRYIPTAVFQALTTVKPMRLRIGGNVQAAKIVKKVQPFYPPEVQTQGTVRLHVIVGVDGSVLDATVLQGDPDLGKAAVGAVRQWRYQPTLLNKQPVEVDTVVDVIFQR